MKKIFMMSALFFGMACSTFATNDVTGIKLLGDANDDGVVDGADLTKVIEAMKDIENVEGLHNKNADANKDGVIDGADLVAIIEIMKNGGTSE